MAAWGRVHARILQDLKAADAERLYAGKVPDAAVFHELVALAEQALGTGGAPVPLEAPIYEVPQYRASTHEERVDRYLNLIQQALDMAKRAEDELLRIAPEMADELEAADDS